MLITSEETETQYIFDKIILYNFKMHKNTELILSETPLTVISGANGSGKTQILEALILALGHKPQRLILSTNEELVGSFDDHCIIKLYINNPRLSDQRVISSSDPEIGPYINKEKFRLEIRINKNGKTRRWISNQKNGRKEVTQRAVQNLVKSIGIYEDAMLNFTEEGCLSSFADGSPHKKLDTLLAATGIKNIYQSYIKSKNRVEEKSKEISPLSIQLEKEQHKLRKLQNSYERLQRKKELIVRFQEVERELVWFDVINSQKQLEELDGTVKKLRTENNNLKEKETFYSKRYKELSEEHSKLEEELSDQQTINNDFTKQMNLLEGQIKEKESNITRLKAEVDSIGSNIKKIKDLNTESGFQRKIELTDELNSINKNVRTIVNNLKHNKESFQEKTKEEEKIKKKIDERSALLGELNRYESELITAVNVFKENLEKSPYKEQILGPIYEIISIDEKYLPLTTVIKAAIGRHLFSFVAVSYESYEESKKIFDEVFPNRKPNFSVGRVLNNNLESEKDSIIKPNLVDEKNGIIGHVLNLIKAPLQLKTFLRRFVNIALADTTLSPNELTDYAVKNRINILTTDGKSFYLSQEAFTRPPLTSNIRLGVSARKYQTFERVRANLLQTRAEMEDIRESDRTLMRERSKLESERRALEEKLRPWELGSDDLENEFLRLERKKSDLEQHIQDEELEIEVIKEKLRTIISKITELEGKIGIFIEEFNEKEIELDTIAKKSEEFNITRVKILRKIDLLSSEIQELTKYNEERKIRAREVGEKPEVIRNDREAVLAEYNQIKGQLDLLEITTDVAPETIEKQEEKVEWMKKEVDENQKHLNNLKTDLDKRLAEWKSELTNVVTHLNRMLNLLLKDVFETISIGIKNYSDERNAALEIKAETQGDKRQYRQLSGGEKTLLAQAIILALHMINQSPLHAIDEFTQKLDKKNRALAFSMALTTYKIAKENRMLTPQFILITPTLDDVSLTEEFTHKVLIESKVVL